ncbi:MAG TPA: hypothetical protein VIM89_01335 [Mucilaginibacter sp.]
MKYIKLISLTIGLILFGCNSDTRSSNSKKNVSSAVKLPDTHRDKDEIQTLIRGMLIWADTKHEIDLLPVLSKDSICTGFDFGKQNQNLEILRKSGFFADEFIDNYNHIIHTLDKKIKNKEFEPWNVYGELPTFNFANDVDPWCSCQDNLSWSKVEVEAVKLSSDKGELKWNWGKLDPGTDPSWKDFSYKFRVVKVSGKWKISYLQGFDYEDSMKGG